MIVCFFGADRGKTGRKYRETIKAFKTKHPDGDVFRLEPESFQESVLAELAVGRGLFGQKFLIACSDLLTEPETRSRVSDKLPGLASSPNTFLFREGELTTETTTALLSAGGRLEECPAASAAKPSAPVFNVFRLTDALGERDSKRLWLLYQEALAAGLPPEAIFWRLVWQVKMMLVVKNSPRPPATIKPFVVGKSSRFLRNFEKDELERLSSRLVFLWHEAKRGSADLGLGLEKIILQEKSPTPPGPFEVV